MGGRAIQSHLRWSFYGICRYISAMVATSLTAVRHFNVPDVTQHKGLVLASNHQSFLDPVLVGMPFEFPVYFLARNTLFEQPIFGPMIRALGAMPVRRGSVDARALRAALTVLRREQPLLLFPEGTRTRDGDLGVMRSGAAMMAARCGVPVVPVCVEGAYEAWPRDNILPRPSPAVVVYGDPIQPGKRSGAELNQIIIDTILDMRDTARVFLHRSTDK